MFSQASCCAAAHLNDSLDDARSMVEDTFLISEILAHKPELIDEFKQENLELRLAMRGGLGYYVAIKAADFHDEETKMNWQGKINVHAGTMR